MKVTVQERQSWFDIAITCCGDALLAFEIARENGMSVTDVIPDGFIALIPDGLSGNQQVAACYSSKKLHPATAVADDFDLGRVFDIPFPLQLS
jgi:hypothetical protein